MARFEGMDEIIQRLNVRFGQRDTVREHQGVGSTMSADTATESQPYAEAVESTMRLLREAEQLRDVTSSGAHEFTQREHDDLVALLAKVIKELWNCEVTLKRAAPYE